MITDELKSELRLLSLGAAVAATSRLQSLLKKLDLDYESKAGNRLSLAYQLSLLDRRQIEDLVGPDVSLQLFWEVDSTNRQVMDCLRPDQTLVCAAELQTAGRGRRGKHWVSPFARNIYLSVGKVLPVRMAELGGLSLAIGIEIAQLLQDQGCLSLGLKWPNDLLTPEGKLGGILVELGAPGPNGIPVCVGIGLNVVKQLRGYNSVEQPVAFLSDYISVNRSVLVAEMSQKIIAAMENHSPEAMSRYQSLWKRFNLFDGRRVQVSAVGGVIEGVDAGIDLQGHLVLKTADGIEYCNAGEVSVRPLNVG
ncbi:MAG: biotin--[acetyl-CoA-carboxylase] ligase [Gammaproteobacteria bacterium]|nr:biotin--[acetyl-CoA-carboxylase] ligase [Gammaproteobacteria bacterium]MBT5601704.1 biotin--[acetyl-CoA-carboxylase] ligase [Gammaproteobacteria bacterium]